MVYNIADTWYIGQLNDTGMMAAVTLVFPAFLMLSAVANLFGIGGASLLSRSLGPSAITRWCAARGLPPAWLAAAATLVYSLAVFVWREPLLSALGADENSLPHASAYLFWTVTVGGLPTSMNMVLAHLIRAEGAVEARELRHEPRRRAQRRTRPDIHLRLGLRPRYGRGGDRYGSVERDSDALSSVLSD